jgi:hypothetical protein
MTDEKPQEIADVIATAIVSDKHTTIITPSGKFHLYDGRISHVEPVKIYSSAVDEEIEVIKKRASSGLFTGNYLIQLYGKLPDSNSPLR